MIESIGVQQVPKNILLIQLGDIGDVVLSIPAFRAVRDNLPQANIIVAVREKAKDLIQHVPWVNGVIGINQDRRSLPEELLYQWSFFSLVRGYHFDLVYDFRMGTRGAILAFFSGAKKRVGFIDPENFWRNRFFNTLYQADNCTSPYWASYYFSLLHADGMDVVHEKPEMRVTPRMQEQAALILKHEGVPSEKSIIAIQPFSLWRYKEWSTEKYIQLIQRILSAYHVFVLITGSQDESERAKDLVSSCQGTGHEGGGRHVFNMAGKTSLGELVAVIRSCRLFIGSDSAGVHIAAAVNTPTVVIFGPSSPASWAPGGDGHAVVQKNLSCVPCRRKGCDDSGVSRCLEELDIEEVWAVVQTQMMRFGFSSN
ncbi:MAG: lipopolysaccharide heptosyltransferase II [Pseudomonadota bacterium]